MELDRVAKHVHELRMMNYKLEMQVIALKGFCRMSEEDFYEFMKKMNLL